MSEEWADTDLVFRQVHPKHWDGKNPNSQAFFPTPQHDDKLSVDDNGLISAEQSWRHFTERLGLQSVGTWALSVDEVKSAGELKLLRSPVTDPDNPLVDNPAHCLIDFSQVPSKGQKKKRAQELAIKASGRGCKFQPPV
jgi:hypothetical protein